LRINRRYGAPLILAIFFLAVTVYAASEMFHHQLKGPSTTAGFPGTLSSNCANSPITSNPSSFSTTTFSTIFQCSGGGPIVTCTTSSAAGTCSVTAIVSQTNGGSELTGTPAGYSDYNLYLIGHGSSVSVNCASISGEYILFLSANPPSSAGQPLTIAGTSSPGTTYDYCADGTFSQPQGSDVFVGWF